MSGEIIQMSPQQNIVFLAPKSWEDISCHSQQVKPASQP